MSYIKINHNKQISTQHISNQKGLDSENLMTATTDCYAQKFNLAYLYVCNPRQFSEKMAKNAKERLLFYLGLRKRENKEPETDSEFHKHIQHHRRVAILDAGIQCTLMALIFKKHGFDATLIDCASDIMDCTSTTGLVAHSVRNFVFCDPLFLRYSAFRRNSGICSAGRWCLFSDLQDTPKWNQFRL